MFKKPKIYQKYKPGVLRPYEGLFALAFICLFTYNGAKFSDVNIENALDLFLSFLGMMISVGLDDPLRTN